MELDNIAWLVLKKVLCWVIYQPDKWTFTVWRHIAMSTYGQSAPASMITDDIHTGHWCTISHMIMINMWCWICCHANSQYKTLTPTKTLNSRFCNICNYSKFWQIIIFPRYILWFSRPYLDFLSMIMYTACDIRGKRIAADSEIRKYICVLIMNVLVSVFI